MLREREIEPATQALEANNVLPVQRKQAIANMETIVDVPASSPNDRANQGLETIAGLPDQRQGAEVPLTTRGWLPPVAHICAELMELQKTRKHCIKTQGRLNRSCEAFIASHFGYSTGLDEKERKSLFAQAHSLRLAIEKGGRTVDDSREGHAPEPGGEGQIRIERRDRDALSVCVPIVIATATSREQWDKLRNGTEKKMRSLARSLPAYSWAKSVSGFGDLGLAIVIGETNDLSLYATKERVWKRLGLAVIDGERQQRHRAIDEATIHGYNPKRRAEIWTIADAMFRHQWRGEKDGVPAHAIGPYGEIYAKRKAYTVTRNWTLKHRDNDARRIMSKALVEDLWKAWRLT